MTEMIHGVGSALADGSAVSTSHTIHARLKKTHTQIRVNKRTTERFAQRTFCGVNVLGRDGNDSLILWRVI